MQRWCFLETKAKNLVNWNVLISSYAGTGLCDADDVIIDLLWSPINVLISSYPCFCYTWWNLWILFYRCCIADMNNNCLVELQVMESGSVVASKTACVAFNAPKYFCTGEHSTPETCSLTRYSVIFKSACPLVHSYAYDDASSTCTSLDRITWSLSALGGNWSILMISFFSCLLFFWFFGDLFDLIGLILFIENSNRISSSFISLL